MKEKHLPQGTAHKIAREEVAKQYKRCFARLKTSIERKLAIQLSKNTKKYLSNQQDNSNNTNQHQNKRNTNNQPSNTSTRALNNSPTPSSSSSLSSRSSLSLVHAIFTPPIRQFAPPPNSNRDGTT